MVTSDSQWRFRVRFPTTREVNYIWEGIIKVVWANQITPLWQHSTLFMSYNVWVNVDDNLHYIQPLYLLANSNLLSE